MRKMKSNLRIIIGLILLAYIGAVFSSESPMLLKSTESIVSVVFSKNDIAKAKRDENYIKLRFDEEKQKEKGNVILLGGNHSVKVFIKNKVSKNAKLLVIAESLGGPLAAEGTLPPVILNSVISDLAYLSVRLPIGEFCKNNKYLATVFLKDGENIYWNQRQATFPIADCGGF